MITEVFVVFLDGREENHVAGIFPSQKLAESAVSQLTDDLGKRNCEDCGIRASWKKIPIQQTAELYPHVAVAYSNELPVHSFVPLFIRCYPEVERCEEQGVVLSMAYGRTAEEALAIARSNLAGRVSQ